MIFFLATVTHIMHNITHKNGYLVVFEQARTTVFSYRIICKNVMKTPDVIVTRNTTGTFV